MSGPKKLPVFLTPKEAASVLAAAVSMRDRLIILLGLLAGLRVREICRLKVEHVQLDEKRMLIHQSKGGKSRYVPLHPKLIRVLFLWVRGGTEGYLFPSSRRAGRPITTRAVRYLIETAGKRAKVMRPDGRVVHPHSLRKRFASQLIKRGVDLATVSKLLGHQKVSTTAIYIQADEDDLRSAVDLL